MDEQKTPRWVFIKSILQHSMGQNELMPAVNRHLHAELNRTGLLIQKANLILGVTHGRTESSKEMTNLEANELIRWLKTQPSIVAPDPRCEKMRRKLIALAWQMNWTTKADMIFKADMVRINAWCIKSGYLHKPLNDYLYNELPKLLSQFQAVYDSYLQSLYKPK